MKPPRKRFPESVKAFLLGDAYNGDPPGAMAGGAIPAPTRAAQPVHEGSSRIVREYAYARAAKAAAENHPHITSDVLRRCEEEGLTTHQAAEELGVARSVLMKVRYHYGLVKPRPKRPGAPAETAAASPALSPAGVKGEVLSTLPVAPFELRQRGRFNAARLARRLEGIVALFKCQEAEDEFELELVIRQAEAREPGSEAVRIESVINSSRLTDAQLADLTEVAREVAGIPGFRVAYSVAGPPRPADQAAPGPEEGDDAP